MTELLVIVGSAAAAGAFLSAFVELLRRFLGKKREEETIEQRIERLTVSLGEATQLINQIGGEIENRHALVAKLQSDIETYKQIKELSQTQVESVAQLLRGELRKEGQRSFWRNVAVNFGFFVLGAIVSGLLVAFL